MLGLWDYTYMLLVLRLVIGRGCLAESGDETRAWVSLEKKKYYLIAPARSQESKVCVCV